MGGVWRNGLGLGAHGERGSSL